MGATASMEVGGRGGGKLAGVLLLHLVGPRNQTQVGWLGCTPYLLSHLGY